MWNKILWKRPILWIIGAYVIFLVIFLMLKNGNPISNFLYRVNCERAGKGGLFTIEAEIVSVKDQINNAKIVIKVVSGDLKGLRAEGNWSEEIEAVPGTRFSADVRLQLPEQASNPGQFDEWLYYKIRKIDYLFQAEDIQILQEGNGIRALLYRSRRYLQQRLESLLPAKEASLAGAILLGNSGSLEPELKSLFQKTGIAHIFAISGLHIMMLYHGIEKVLFRLAGRKGKQAAMFLLWVYTFFTGAAVSTLRAALMVTLKETSGLLFQEEDPVITISLTAFLLLIWQPLYLLDAGFQLSFGAILSLRILTPIFERGYRLPAFLRKKLAPSLAVSVGTGPISLWHFYQLSPYAPLLNLVVVPLMNGVLLFSAAACVTALIWERAARFLIGPVYYILQLYQWLGNKTQSLPGCLWEPGRPSFAALLTFYLFILLLYAALSSPRVKRRVLIRKSCVFLFLFLILCGMRGKKKQITFLNIGQGDCAVLEWNRRVYLVDAGPQYASVIKPFLRYSGIHTIDGLFLSHFDQDHVEGALQLLSDSDFSVNTIYRVSEEIQDNQNEKWKDIFDKAVEGGSRILIWEAGDVLQIGDGSLYCLSPSSKMTYSSENDSSMVLLWKTPQLRVLFTGDIEMTGEDKLPSQYLSADVLKVAHHGSRSSTGIDFLKKVSPGLAVISSQRSVYGHPHEETIERLEEQGISYAITEETGAVTVYVWGSRSRYRTYVTPAGKGY